MKGIRNIVMAQLHEIGHTLQGLDHNAQGDKFRIMKLTEQKTQRLVGLGQLEKLNQQIVQAKDDITKFKRVVHKNTGSKGTEKKSDKISKAAFKATMQSLKKEVQTLENQKADLTRKITADVEFL
ncbi:MAG: hypothetical protein S4CHLAM27_05780 [Chlamydiia bacterium]|nr:hypothetical protein [Chlamydiia bacterium]